MRHREIIIFFKLIGRICLSLVAIIIYGVIFGQVIVALAPAAGYSTYFIIAIILFFVGSALWLAKFIRKQLGPIDE